MDIILADASAWLSYAIILIVLGVILALLEVFIPSGGILGLLAAAAIVSSVVMAFKHGEAEEKATGFIFLTAVVILVPVVIILGLKIFPKTPFGRRVILKPSVESPHQRGAAGVSGQDYSNLVGMKGLTVTPLRPSGIAEIGRERLSVVAEGEMIDKDVEIVVVRIEGNNIVVDQYVS